MGGLIGAHDADRGFFRYRWSGWIDPYCIACAASALHPASKVENGSRLVNAAGSTMIEVVQRVAGVLFHIAQASVEQRRGEDIALSAPPACGAIEAALDSRVRVHDAMAHNTAR